MMTHKTKGTAEGAQYVVYVLPAYATEQVCIATILLTLL